MPSQLKTYLDSHGPELAFGRKKYTVLGLTEEGDLATGTSVATVKSVRATYTAVRCNNAKVIGKPGAETWAIMANSGRDIAKFAVFEGGLIELS